MIGTCYYGNQTISNSYSRSKVSGAGTVGGLVGALQLSTPSSESIHVSYCYSSSQISGTGLLSPFVGSVTGSQIYFDNSFFDSQINPGYDFVNYSVSPFTCVELYNKVSQFNQSIWGGDNLLIGKIFIF